MIRIKSAKIELFMLHELYSVVKEHNQQLLVDDAATDTFGVSIILLKNDAIDIERMNFLGYDFERGRIRAQQEGTVNKQLAMRLRSFIDMCLQLNSLQEEVDRINEQIHAIDLKEKALNDQNRKRIFISVLLAIIGIIIGFRSSHFLYCVIFVGFAFLIPRGLSLRNIADRNTCISSREKLQNTRALLGNQIDDLDRRIDYRIMPRQYQYREASEFFYQRISYGLAQSIPQAISQYEDHLAKQEQLEMQRQQIEMQRQQIYELQRLQAMAQYNNHQNH